MKTNTPVITPAETAYLLRQHLGPLRAWADFLTDNIRGRQSVEGITLKPCAKWHDGKNKHPMYAVIDVKAFIDAVQAANPEARPTKVKAVTLAIDRGRVWWTNKFDQRGQTMNSLIFAAGAGAVSHRAH